MKKLFVASLALAALATPVNAADLPVKAKAPPVTTAVNWTGCYIGLNAGYGWGKDSVFNVVDEGQPSFSGGLAGGQIGCDYQFATSWVVGIEAMYDFANLKGDVIDPANTAATTGSKFKNLGSVAGRIGYAFDRSLLYVKGGYGWSRSERTIVGPGFSQSTGNVTKGSYVIGGGWEYMIAPNWSAKIEYNHYNFGAYSESVTQLPSGAVFVQDDRNKGVDVVMVGVNFRFR